MTFTKTLIITGICTLLSRLLGFIRDAAIAWLLGTGVLADAFSLALRLPYLFRRLLSEGSLSMGLTTQCAALGNAGACRLAFAVIQRAAMFLIFPVGLAAVYAPEIISVLSPGGKFSLFPDTVLLFQICLPYIWFAVLSAACMAGLHARGHFLSSGISPIAFNCAMLTGAAAALLGSFSPRETALLLAGSVLLGGFAQFFVQFPLLFYLAHHETETPIKTFRALKELPSGLAAASVPQLIFVLACIPASFLGEGHLSALFYAERLLEFPLGLTAATLGISAVPVIAAAIHRGPEALGLNASAAMGLALCVSLPAAAGLAAVGAPLVKLLFAHGAMNAQACQMTTLYLYAAIPGLPAYAMLRPLIAACHTADIRCSLFSCALAALSISIGAGFALTVPLGLTAGPAIGVDAGLWAQAGILWLLLGKRIPIRLPWNTIALSAAASLAVYGVAAVLAVTLPTPGSAVITAVPAGIAAFIAIIWPARGKLQDMANTLRTPCDAE